MKKNKFTEKLRQLLRSFIFYFRLVFYRSVFIKNRILKNKYRGERCFIICTGVSVNDVNIRALQSENIFACNYVYRHPDFNCLKPLAYFDMDPVYGMKKTYESKKAILEFYEAIDRSSPQNTIFVTNASNKNFLQQNGLFLKREKFFVSRKNVPSMAKDIEIDMAGNFNPMNGVVYAMIAASIYMGFKEVYLIGCDYTFQPCRSGHFYDNISLITEMPSEKLHAELNQVALSRECKIRNIVPDGFSSPIYEKVTKKDLSEMKIML